MELEKILNDFEILQKHLNLAIKHLESNQKNIIDELQHWKSEITIKELEESLNLINEKVNKWFNLYVETKDILQIGLSEYDLVSKESSYILGECALIDDVYAEVIDFQIGCIGAAMCDEIKKGGKTYE